MLHSILTAAVAQRGVTPVMFGDKFGVRSCWNRLRLASRRHVERFPFLPASPPAVFSGNPRSIIDDRVSHRQGDIRFTVKCAGDERDRAARNELTYKNNAAPPRVSRFLPNIEAQIHFFEIPMQRNGKAEQARVEKE